MNDIDEPDWDRKIKEKRERSKEAAVRTHTLGQCTIIISKDILNGKELWHLSISHPSRYPTWEEIKEARYRFIPDEITMAQILPPRKEYINLHNNCFHLWEI